MFWDSYCRIMPQVAGTAVYTVGTYANVLCSQSALDSILQLSSEVLLPNFKQLFVTPCYVRYVFMMM